MVNITNLKGTTWRLDVANFVGLQASYGQFNINGHLIIHDPEMDGYSMNYTNIYIGYGVDGTNSLINDENSVAFFGDFISPEGESFPLNLAFNSEYHSTVILEFTITGGADISNAKFIDFINTYGTLVSSGEPPTAESVKAKLKSLIAKANTATGKEDQTLTLAVNTLIEGYGQGKPPVLQEKTVTENGEVIPDEGYDGLSKVTVMVQAVSYYGEHTNL